MEIPVPGASSSGEAPLPSMLHATVHGHGPRLVFLHGFAQTSRCWGPLQADLVTDHELCLIDAPGHGGSSNFPAGLRTGARLMADQGGEASYLGYSMGGRFALHLALAFPELVRGLILIGATAGIEDREERAQRQANDQALAARLRRDGLEAFLHAWVAQPLFAGLPEEMRFHQERLSNTVEGLAGSLEQAGTGSQDPLWHRLAQLDMPILVLAGVLDPKFTDAGQRIVEAIGANATFVGVPGAGHAAHLESPAATLAILRPWLKDHHL